MPQEQLAALVAQLGPSWTSILSELWQEPELPELLQVTHDFDVVSKTSRRARIATFAEAQIKSRTSSNVSIGTMLVARSTNERRLTYRVVCAFNLNRLAFLTLWKSRLTRSLTLADYHEATRSSNLPISLEGRALGDES